MQEKTYIQAIAKITDLSLEEARCEAINIAKSSKSHSVEISPLEVQQDLMKMISILLSTGFNKNDDYFLPEEVLPCRNTGAHKPVDIEHDPSKIIGHILRSYVTLKDDTIIPDDQDPDTSEFDITNEAVIYKYQLPDIAKIIQDKAKNNELFVSVEVWFSDYDYILGNKIIKRTSETASKLDEYLRIKGGNGIYQNQKVGRILRNMIIGGVGVVKKPANPESIIKSIANISILDVSTIDEVLTKNIIGEFPMKKAVSTIELSEAGKPSITAMPPIMPIVNSEDMRIHMTNPPNYLADEYKLMFELIDAERRRCKAQFDELKVQFEQVKDQNKQLVIDIGKVKEFKDMLDLKNAIAFYESRFAALSSIFSDDGVNLHIINCSIMSDKDFSDFIILKTKELSYSKIMKSVNDDQQPPKGGNDTVIQPPAQPDPPAVPVTPPVEIPPVAPITTLPIVSPPAQPTTPPTPPVTTSPPPPPLPVPPDPPVTPPIQTPTQAPKPSVDDVPSMEGKTTPVESPINIETSTPPSTDNQLAKIFVAFLGKKNPKWNDLLNK